MYSYNTRVRYSEVDETRDATLLSVINWFQDCCTFEAEGTEAWELTGSANVTLPGC